MPGAVCPNCGVPLVNFLMLNALDPVLGLAGIGLTHLPLLHCPRCKLFDAEFVYRVAPGHRIDIITANEGREPWLSEAWRELHPDGQIAEIGCWLRPMPDAVQAVIDKATAQGDRSLDASELQTFASFTGYFADEEVGGHPYFDMVNQVGGRPFLEQGPPDAWCPYCARDGRQEEMQFLACLINDPARDLHIIYPECYLTFCICTVCSSVTAEQFAL